MIELRTASVSNVRFKERIVDLLAVPYDETALVPYRGGLIEESFAPGAFTHYGYEPGKLLALLEHDRDRIIGKVTRLDPYNRSGLRSELFIRRSEEGDQALLDAEDRLLDASVAFAVRPEDERWEGHSRRRIVKAFLDHIALTFTPAYSGAKVLAVRTGPASRTPNLDRVLSTPNLDRVLAGR